MLSSTSQLLLTSTSSKNRRASPSQALMDQSMVSVIQNCATLVQLIVGTGRRSPILWRRIITSIVDHQKALPPVKMSQLPMPAGHSVHFQYITTTLRGFQSKVHSMVSFQLPVLPVMAYQCSAIPSHLASIPYARLGCTNWGGLHGVTVNLIVESPYLRWYH